MCEQCDKFDVTIAVYRQLKVKVTDHQVHQAADKLIEELEAKRRDLHPKE